MKEKIILLISLAILAGYIISMQGKKDSRPEMQTQPVNLLEDERNNIDVFKNTVQSVVYIRNMRVSQRNLFSPAETQQAGSGSGFIWDNAGHIVTN